MSWIVANGELKHRDRRAKVSPLSFISDGELKRHDQQAECRDRRVELSPTTSWSITIDELKRRDWQAERHDRRAKASPLSFINNGKLKHHNRRAERHDRWAKASSLSFIGDDRSLLATVGFFALGFLVQFGFFLFFFLFFFFFFFSLTEMLGLKCWVLYWN